MYLICNFKFYFKPSLAKFIFSLTTSTILVSLFHNVIDRIYLILEPIMEPNSFSALSKLKPYFSRKTTELPNTDTCVCQLCKKEVKAAKGKYCIRH